MKMRFLPFAAFAVWIGMTSLAEAGLQPGANVLPSDVRNVATGEQYCQMCAYSGRAGTVVHYGDGLVQAEVRAVEVVKGLGQPVGQVPAHASADALRPYRVAEVGARPNGKIVVWQQHRRVSAGRPALHRVRHSND